MGSLFRLIGMLLLLSAPVGLLAQDNEPLVFCGSLSTADCDLLNAANQTMRELESSRFSFDLNLTLDDLPDTPLPLSIRLNGGGAFRLDADRLSDLLNSPDYLQNNLQMLPQLMENALEAFAADATVVLHFSDSLALLSLDSDFQLPSKAGLSLRMVDGFLYLNLDKLAELAPDTTMLSGWMGLDLAGFYRALLEQQSEQFEVPGFYGQTPVDQALYMDIERLEDLQLGAQTMAVFKTTTDMDALLETQEFDTALREQLQTNPSFNNLLSAADIDDMIAAYRALLATLTIEMTQAVGLDDHYLHRVTVSMDWPIEMSEFARLMPYSGLDSIEPVTFQMTLAVDLDQFNAAPDISAPPDAFIIPLDSMLPADPRAFVPTFF